MFTVLHRGPDGAETLYEVTSIKRCQPKGTECVPAHGDFKLYGVRLDDVPAGAEIHLTIERPFGAIFVMNRFGSTVARYLATPGPYLASAEKRADLDDANETT